MNQRGSSLIEMMVALTVFGIVVTGTYDGLTMVNRSTVDTIRSVDAQMIAEQALLILEGLPDDSTALTADGDQLDLFDYKTPDKVAHPLTGNEWFETGSPVQYRVFYNVARDVNVANMAEVRVFVTWEADGGQPALPASPTRSVQRTLSRGIAPL
jgi:prepilin-type N-terminal cleavage/methylation domain-containing protein